jgi:hypothetical protein
MQPASFARISGIGPAWFGLNQLGLARVNYYPQAAVKAACGYCGNLSNIAVE